MSRREGSTSYQLCFYIFASGVGGQMQWSIVILKYHDVFLLYYLRINYLLELEVGFAPKSLMVIAAALTGISPPLLVSDFKSFPVLITDTARASIRALWPVWSHRAHPLSLLNGAPLDLMAWVRGACTPYPTLGVHVFFYWIVLSRCHKVMLFGHCIAHEKEGINRRYCTRHKPF